MGEGNNDVHAAKETDLGNLHAKINGHHLQLLCFSINVLVHTWCSMYRSSESVICSWWFVSSQLL